MTYKTEIVSEDVRIEERIKTCKFTVRFLKVFFIKEKINNKKNKKHSNEIQYCSNDSIRKNVKYVLSDL